MPRLGVNIDHVATIRQALVDAEDAKRRSEEAEAQYKQLVDQARTEARGLVEEANRLAHA